MNQSQGQISRVLTGGPFVFWCIICNFLSASIEIKHEFTWTNKNFTVSSKTSDFSIYIGQPVCLSKVKYSIHEVLVYEVEWNDNAIRKW